MTRRTLPAWLELLRIPNAPTVASNVLAGVAVGMLARLGNIAVPMGTVLPLLAGALLVYLAGMVLNDAFDARVDAHERPARPIPSGRVALRSARWTGLAMLATGTALLAFVGMPTDGPGTLLSAPTVPWALLLCAAVLGYDVLHLQFRASVVLVPSCRALVIVVAALGTSPGADAAAIAWVALPLLAYVLAVSVAARDEVKGFGAAGRAVAWTLPVAAVAPMGAAWSLGLRPDGIGMALAVAGSLAMAVVGSLRGIRAAHAGNVPAAVGAWLGAIPATDAAVCFLLGRPMLGGACLALWALGALLRRRVAAS